MPAVHANGITLHYQRGGSGAPVVFVHGGFASLATRLIDFSAWEWSAGSWETDLARRFDFVWYDRRGCYRSAAPPDGYDPETQARDLAGLLDALGIDAAHVIGSSAGGPITTVFAALHPERVRSIVLAGTGLRLFPADDPVTRTIRDVGRVLEREGPAAAFDKRPEVVEATYISLWGHVEAAARGRLTQYRESERAQNERARRVRRDERVYYHAVELRNLLAYVESDVHAPAARVRCPALVLHGSDDRDVPVALAEELARTIRGAQLQILEREGHSVVHRSEAGRRAAIEWITAQERQRGA